MIILSIPYKSEEFVKNLPNVNNFDFIEFRLDYHPVPLTFPKELINPKTIITIRDDSEKETPSAQEISTPEKIEYYTKVIEENNCFVDVELSLLVDTSVSDFVKKYSKNIILSHHNFSPETNFESLKKVIQYSNKIPSAYTKTAVSISRYDDLLKLKEVNKLSENPLISVGMGKLGKISRILYKHLGSVGTFIGANDAPTASGQLTTEEAKLYNLTNLNENTKIGGIIGGEQASESLGLKFYNNYFAEKKLNAVYLPFATKDLSELKEWILKSGIKFYGFSVTMPYKEEVGIGRKEIGEKFSAANLWLPETDEFFNTDLIAFEKSFKYLELKKDDKILIYGSGATAETALFALKNYCNVFVSGRNTEKTNFLADKYSRKVLSEYSKTEINLFINCTPIVAGAEKFAKEKFSNQNIKVIDLPYSDKKTSLIENCIKEKIPYIDGEIFWEYQSEKQLIEFRKQKT